MGALGACETGQGRLRGIEELARVVSEGSPAMRAETPKRVWEREESGKKYTGTRLWGNESSPVMWPGPPTGRVKPSGNV